jgi:hypothetical protein
MSKIKKVVGLGVVVAIVGAFLWFSPTILSYFQNFPSSASYTSLSLTLRDTDTMGSNQIATLDFGDTEYNFSYSSYLGLFVSTFMDYEGYTPHIGDVYKFDGIEIDVSNITSDYISNYILVLVKPTVQNYMASLHYTRLNITLNHDIAVNISSGITNETHLYDFSYHIIVISHQFGPPESTNLEIHTDNNYTEVEAYVYPPNTPETYMVRVLNIEIRAFAVEPQYMVIYVKPLY